MAQSILELATKLPPKQLLERIYTCTYTERISSQYRRDILYYFQTLINDSKYLSLDIEGLAYIPKISIKLELYNPKFWNIVSKQVHNLLRTKKIQPEKVDSISSILVDYAVVHPLLDSRFFHALEREIGTSAQHLSSSGVSGSLYGFAKLNKVDKTTLAALEQTFCEKYRDFNLKDLIMMSFALSRLAGLGESDAFKKAMDEIIMHYLGDMSQSDISMLVLGLGMRDMYLPCVETIQNKVAQEIDQYSYINLKEITKGFAQFNRDLECKFVSAIDNMEEKQVEKSHKVLKSYIKERLDIYN